MTNDRIPRTAAASATRKPLNANGSSVRMPALTTLKLTPQMRAISSRPTSVTPNDGREGIPKSRHSHGPGVPCPHASLLRALRRPANIFGPKAAFLASLPGIGIDRVQAILEWSDDNIAHALSGLTDLDIKGPAGVGIQTRLKIKEVLGLEENQSLEVLQKEAVTNG